MLLRLLLAVLAFLLIRWVIIKLANLKETPKDKIEDQSSRGAYKTKQVEVKEAKDLSLDMRNN